MKNNIKLYLELKNRKTKKKMILNEIENNKHNKTKT